MAIFGYNSQTPRIPPRLPGLDALLETYGTTRIVYVEVIQLPLHVIADTTSPLFRAPLGRVIEDMQVTQISHTLLRLNDTLFWEKRDRIHLHQIEWEDAERTLDRWRQCGARFMTFPVQRDITLAQLIQAQRECMGTLLFTQYDPLHNNCQHFVAAALLCLNIPLRWVEIESLLEQTAVVRPSFQWTIHALTRPFVTFLRRTRIRLKHRRRRRRHRHDALVE